MRKLRSNYAIGSSFWAVRRAQWRALGLTDEDMAKPKIAIVNTSSELAICFSHLDGVAKAVKEAIRAAGGLPFEIRTAAPSDFVTSAGLKARYLMPTRDLVVNDIEVMVEAHQLDAIVLLGSCDKIVPGMLMAAARLDIPAIFLPGGPMLGGVVFDNRKSDLTTMSEALGMLKNQAINEETYEGLEDICVPTCGSCAFLGTANTMCCLAEAMGMSLPGSALIPAVYADRLRIGEETGKAIVNLAKNGVKAKDIITLESLRNAARVLMAIGGSTNGILHLTAVAAEIGISAEEMMNVYDCTSETTPQVAKVNPASKYDMEDFYKAGGIPQVMQEIKSLLHLECRTVTGATMGENLEQFRGKFPVNREVIKTMSEPFNALKGLAILKGNLAPDTAVTKPAAIDPSMWTFTGIARVFDSEELAEAAILAGKIKEGDVVVIRYEGPKGGPGMREMYKAMKYIYGMGLAKKTALITDGRFSGTNNGCFVGHISPEAAEGGPLAVVVDGDTITIDIPGKVLQLHVSEEEIASRLKTWKRPAPKFTKGYLGLYTKLASSAASGAILRME